MAEVSASVCVAIIGGDDDALDILELGLRQFPARKITILSRPKEPKAAEVARALSSGGFKVETREMPELGFEQVFKAVAEAKWDNPGSRVLINTETDYRTSCIALSAAFVNGLQAIGVLDDRVIAYPIMKFSYYSALSGKKTKLLELVSKAEGGRISSLEELGEKAGMSLPLVIYHLRGSREKTGLEELGLVELSKSGGRVGVSLTALGRLIVGGYVDFCKDGCRDAEKHARAHAMVLKQRVH